MFKTIFHTALILGMAIGGGAWLTWYALRGSDHFEAVTIGGWTAYPQAGTPDADPYAKARLARDGSLSLGAAEGVIFFADKDSGGGALSGKCSYSLEGASPSARLWTLFAVKKNQTPLQVADQNWPTSLHSEGIVYDNDGKFKVAVAANARANNWLAIPSTGEFMLAFTLYDSPVATNKGLVETSFPTLKKVGCHA